MTRKTLIRTILASQFILPSSANTLRGGSSSENNGNVPFDTNAIRNNNSSGGRDLSFVNADVHKKSSHLNLFDSDDDSTRSMSQLDKQSRIIGGTEADAEDFQYLVSMQDGGFGHYCGASMIAPDMALTAAHCLGGEYKVVFGRFNLDINNGQAIQKIKEIEHPEYNPSKSNNDFGLIILARPVTNAQIVRLNEDNSYPQVGALVTVAGWGDTKQSDSQTELSDSLMRVNVNVISNNDCEDSSDGRGLDYFNQITDNMLCATITGGGKDACQGDSGGPLIATTNVGDVQVGVVSWGIGCGREAFPGVYSRVSSAYDWIRNKVCDNSKSPPASFNCGSGGTSGLDSSSSSAGENDDWTSIFTTEFTKTLNPFSDSGSNTQRLDVAQFRNGVMHLQYTGKAMTNEFDVKAYSKCQSIVNFKILRMSTNEGWCVDYSSNKGMSYIQAKCFKGMDYSTAKWYDGEKASFSVGKYDSIILRFRCTGNSVNKDVFISRAKLQCQ